MSNDPIDIITARMARRTAEIERLQFERGMDGLSEYAVTASAIIDAIFRDVSIIDIHEAFMDSPNVLSFETRLWAMATLKEKYPPMPKEAAP